MIGVEGISLGRGLHLKVTNRGTRGNYEKPVRKICPVPSICWAKFGKP
jgi:hypothetical protein